MFIAPTVGIGGMSPFKTVYPRKNGRTEGGHATVSGYLLLDAVNGGVLALQVYRRDLDYVRFVRFRY